MTGGAPVSVARVPIALPPMPAGCAMEIVDELVVATDVATMFSLARDVEEWPVHLSHYRRVRMLERAGDGGGVVEMAANRPFHGVNWPTWWVSAMTVDAVRPAIRFRHVRGITRGMDVEWSFAPVPAGVRVRIVHAWNGPSWPLIGVPAARLVIGPVFIHGIASRTLRGLGRAALTRSASVA